MSTVLSWPISLSTPWNCRTIPPAVTAMLCRVPALARRPPPAAPRLHPLEEVLPPRTGLRLQAGLARALRAASASWPVRWRGQHSPDRQAAVVGPAHPSSWPGIRRCRDRGRPARRSSAAPASAVSVRRRRSPLPRRRRRPRPRRPGRLAPGSGLACRMALLSSSLTTSTASPTAPSKMPAAVRSAASRCRATATLAGA